MNLTADALEDRRVSRVSKAEPACMPVRLHIISSLVPASLFPFSSLVYLISVTTRFPLDIIRLAVSFGVCTVLNFDF